MKFLMRSAWMTASCLLAVAAPAVSAPPSPDRPDLSAAGAPGPGRAEGLVIETLLTGAGANIEFGAGVLKATDIYVAGGKQLLRFPDNPVPGAPVPWHEPAGQKQLR